MTNSPKVKGFLIERDGRSLFMKEVEAWAIEDANYKVTPLVSGLMEDREEPLVDVPKEEAPSLPSTDDTAERIQLMNELFDLQQKEIDFLKSALETAVEVIETVGEFSAKKSDNFLENKATLLLISAACQNWLKERD